MKRSEFHPEFNPRAIPAGGIPIIRPPQQQPEPPQPKPPPFNPNECYKVTLLREHGNQEYWTADPQDPAEPDEEVTYLDGTKVMQKRFAMGGVLEMCRIDLRRCYSYRENRVLLHKEFTSLGTPFLIERVPKPEWWSVKDSVPAAAKAG